MGVTPSARVPISSRIGPQLAWAVAAAMLVLALVQLAVLAERDRVSSSSVGTLAMVVLPVCGALVVNQQPANRIGWVLLVAGVAGIVPSLIDGAALVALAPSKPSTALALTGDVLWPFGAPLLFATVMLLFPAGRCERRWRLLLLVGAAGIGLLTVSSTTAPWDDRYHGGLTNPLAVVPVPVGPLIHAAGLVLVAIAGAAGIARAIALYRTGSHTDRAQLRVLLAFALAAVALVAVAALIGIVVPLPPWVDSSLPATVLLGFPVSIAVAVVRGRLFTYHVVVNRTALVAGGRLATVGVVLIGAALVLRANKPIAPSWWFVTGVVAALAATWASSIVATRLSRRVQGPVADPMGAVTSFPAAPASIDSGVLAQWADLVRDTLRVPFIDVSLDGGPNAHAGARVSLPTDRIDLIANDRRVGQLVVAHRSPSDRFSSDDQALILALARQITRSIEFAAVAERARSLSAEVATSSGRERERVRRDLHDQLGPRLAGVTYLLAGVDPEETAGPLAMARAELIAAVADVRRLAHDLRPQPVELHGPSEAIRQHARRWSDATGIDLEMAVDDVADVSMATATSLYAIALEAMTNIERHAHATRCRVELQAERSMLVLTVSDDGIGVGRDPGPGIGLESMRARAVELDAVLTIDGSCGTTVRFEVPRHG